MLVLQKNGRRWEYVEKDVSTHGNKCTDRLCYCQAEMSSTDTIEEIAKKDCMADKRCAAFQIRNGYDGSKQMVMITKPGRKWKISRYTVFCNDDKCSCHEFDFNRQLSPLEMSQDFENDEALDADALEEAEEFPSTEFPQAGLP
jgi:hypothetical protein